MQGPLDTEQFAAWAQSLAPDYGWYDWLDDECIPRSNTSDCPIVDYLRQTLGWQKAWAGELTYGDGLQHCFRTPDWASDFILLIDQTMVRQGGMVTREDVFEVFNVSGD